MKINSAILEGAKFLRSKYISTSYLDSEILMAKAINKNRKYVLMNLDKNLLYKDFKNYLKLIKKRSLRKPVAYLTNKKYFWKSEFFVTKDTLIPRPDTEILIESILDYSKNKNEQNILDIGIGSGDRSERIRTYNFPQGRVTDHRINLTLHKLDEFLEGEAFDEMIESLTLQAQEESLNSL